jgi:predicted Zn-dependent protease
MSTGDELLELGDSTLALLQHGEAEVVIADSRSELTRFAGNEIHQSVAERYRHVRVRLIDGGRTGVGEVRGHGDRAVARAFDAAEQSRRVTSTSDGSPLPAGDQGGDGPVAFAESTAAPTPQQRAELVATITEAASSHGINSYGALSTTTTTTAIITSAGLRRSATSTQASLV